MKTQQLIISTLIVVWMLGSLLFMFDETDRVLSEFVIHKVVAAISFAASIAVEKWCDKHNLTLNITI